MWWIDLITQKSKGWILHFSVCWSTSHNTSPGVFSFPYSVFFVPLPIDIPPECVKTGVFLSSCHFASSGLHWNSVWFGDDFVLYCMLGCFVSGRNCDTQNSFSSSVATEKVRICLISGDRIFTGCDLAPFARLWDCVELIWCCTLSVQLLHM